jgi:hypothetical protein
MSYRPYTSVGSAVLAFLRRESLSTAVGLAGHPRTSPELVYQAFVLMARRRFAGAFGAGSDEFVRASLEADGSVSEEHVRWASSALASALTVRGSKPVKIPGRFQEVVVSMLLYAAREPSVDDDVLVALVSEAESRLVRGRRLGVVGGGRGLIGKVLSRRGSLAPQRPEGEPGGAPSSVVGRRIRAMVEFDDRLLQSYPEEPDEGATAAMIDGVFRQAMLARFEAGRDDVRRFAEQVVSLNSGLPVSAAQLTGIIGEALGASAGPEDVSYPDLMRAEVAVFVDTVEELGLFGQEKDDLIRHAEEGVRSAGHPLSIWEGAARD